MAPERITFETIMAAVGCITTVLLALKGMIRVCVESIELIPRAIKGWKDSAIAWRNRRIKKVGNNEEEKRK